MSENELYQKTLQNLNESSSLSGHELLFGFLQGSQNYNLEVKSSDVDCKGYFYPTFDDLYNGKFLSHTYDVKHGQVASHDVRLLPDLLGKMNPTYLELFFSKMVVSSDDSKALSVLKTPEEFFNNLYFSRRTILLKSLCGVTLMKCQEAFHWTENRKDVFDKYGYDIKAASHAIRDLYLFKSCLEKEFSNPYLEYGKLIRLEDEEVRKTILDVKLGKMKMEEANDLIAKIRLETLELRAEVDKLPTKISDSDPINPLKDEIQQIVREKFRK
ncbi:MAG: nucleotidyltransferase domain-containing protein [Bacilli bacterium]|nr:nucleotidyltransferase domain-containing protein [Bacilli bacterium]